MSNYEVVHHFFSQDDRKIMGKKNDLIVVDKNKGMWFYITHDGCPMIGDAQIDVVDDLLSQHKHRGTLTTTRKKYRHEKEI